MDPPSACMHLSACSGYGSPSEDFELGEAPVHKTVTGNEPEQVRSAWNPRTLPHSCSLHGLAAVHAMHHGFMHTVQLRRRVER